jgi:adenosylhomocysteinase
VRDCDIKDATLSSGGKKRIEWASRDMPVLRIIGERLRKEKPFKDIRISACLHITTETANLALILKDGGADIRLCASNPLSTQDDIVSALNNFHIPTYAKKGEDKKTYYEHIDTVLNHKPHLTMDDGADLVAAVHSRRTELLSGIIGGTEETTTGVVRLRSLEKAGKLKYPIIAVNDAKTKHLFDNRYGTGQSTIDGITRVTNILWAGKTVLVCGYGWCGRGIAMRARGMGARVSIAEVDPVKALEAVMDGYEVRPIKEALPEAEVVITATGGKNIVGEDEFQYLRDGAILANSGHFNVEIDIKMLGQIANRRNVKPMVDEWRFGSGCRIYLLAEGRLVNLSCAEGHPASVMDMSFANQALCLEHIVKQGRHLEPRVYPVPGEIDGEVARLKLEAMGVGIDRLTKEQEEYLGSWSMGT